MEQLNTQQPTDVQDKTSKMIVEEVSEQILNALASLVNVGPNGEPPRYDLDKLTPALLFVGAMNGMCDAFSQLHSTEEKHWDYVTSMTAIQDLFTRYLIERNVSAALDMVANQDDLMETDPNDFPMPLSDTEEPIIEQIFDPSC